MSRPGYNLTCRLRDFVDLAADMRAVYPHEAAARPDFPKGQEYRKTWEITQVVRGLEAFGALGARARILGVGAGIEWTSYYLTTRAEQVFATDLYLSPDFWPEWSPAGMLSHPEMYAPAGAVWDARRLAVMNMDGRSLRFPDNFFDGVFCTSSIEHFGTLEEIALSARQMGRVLRPGGVLAIVTEFKLDGPPGGNGWENVVVFDAALLARTIIEPSGCFLVDEPDYGTDAPTLATAQDLDWVVRARREGRNDLAPHIVLTHRGYTVTSVSLVAVKP